MSVSEPDPQLPESLCTTPPAFPELTPPQFLRFTLLMAVRDGLDRITLRPSEAAGWYDMVGWHRGEEFGIIGPTAEATQEFPAILASLVQQAGAVDQPGHSGRGRVDGCESAEFVLPIGPASVRGGYQVRWELGLVAELEIGLPPATEAVAAAAHRDLRELVRAARSGEPATTPDPAA